MMKTMTATAIREYVHSVDIPVFYKGVKYEATVESELVICEDGKLETQMRITIWNENREEWESPCIAFYGNPQQVLYEVNQIFTFDFGYEY